MDTWFESSSGEWTFFFLWLIRHLEGSSLIHLSFRRPALEPFI